VVFVVDNNHNDEWNFQGLLHDYVGYVNVKEDLHIDGLNQLIHRLYFLSLELVEIDIERFHRLLLFAFLDQEKQNDLFEHNYLNVHKIVDHVYQKKSSFRHCDLLDLND
jgi:hypothetical protein